jgi:hypothetical protein
MSERIRTGNVEPIEVYITDKGSDPLTGLTGIYVRVRRVSDGYYFDWNDWTFKNTGWTTLNKLTTEVDATNFPGLYKVTGGLDTSAITNPTADDDYQILVLESPAGQAVLPNPGLLRVGQWVDQIDTIFDKLPTNYIMGSGVQSDKDDEIDAILADTSAIDARLPADPATETSIAALNDLDITDVQTALTNQGYTTARAPKLDNLDVAVSTRTEPGDPVILENFERAAVVDAVWNELLSGHTIVGSAGKVLSDIGTTVGTPTDTAAAVWNALRATYNGAGSFGESIRLNASGLLIDAINEIRNSILSDSTPFDGAKIDVAISTRAVQGDAMDLLPGSVDSVALDTSAADEIADRVWDENAGSHVGAGTTGQLLNRLDVAVSSRSETGDPMSLTANSVTALALASDAIAEIADGVWDELLAGHIGVGSAGEALALVDVAVSSRAAPGDDMGLTTAAINAAADQVWEETLADHSGTAGSTAEAQAYLDAAVSSRAVAGDAMDLITDALDAGSLATSAVDEIVDQVWREQISDHSGVVGSTAETLANVAAPPSVGAIADAVWDEVVTTGHAVPNSAAVVLVGRSAPGDAMDLITDAVDAAALATSGVNEIRDSILSDSTSFAGANIDAAISSRAVAGDAMALTAGGVDAIWDEDIVAAHGTADTSGLLLRALGAGISQRTNNATLAALLGVSDIAGQDIATAIDTELSGVHGAGSWTTAVAVGDWTTTEKNQIRGALGVVGVQASPAGGGELQDILEDTAAMDARLPSDPADESLQQASHSTTQAAIAALNDLDAAAVATATQTGLTAQGYSSARAGYLDYLDVAVSSRSSHSAADVDTELSGTHGAGSWESFAGDWTSGEKEQIRDALGVTGATSASVGGVLQDINIHLGTPAGIDTVVSLLGDMESPTGDVALANAEAVWETILAPFTTAGSAGKTLASCCQVFAGARQIEITIEDTGSVPIQGAQIDLYDATNTNFLTRVWTDIAGEVTLALDDGSYNLRIWATGYSFTVPEPLVVTADASVTYQGTTGPTFPSSPDLCVIYGYVVDGGGAPIGGACVTAEPTTPQAPGGSQTVEYPIHVLTRQDGYFEMELLRDLEVRFQIEDTGYDEIKTVPDAASQFLGTWP